MNESYMDFDAASRNRQQVAEAAGLYAAGYKRPERIGPQAGERGFRQVGWSEGLNFPWSFRFVSIPSRIIEPDLIQRSCISCGSAFFIEAYHGLVDDDFALPAELPGPLLERLKTAYRALRRCPYHAGKLGPRVRTGWLHAERGCRPPKAVNEASRLARHPIGWRFIYRRSFSLLGTSEAVLLWNKRFSVLLHENDGEEETGTVEPLGYRVYQDSLGRPYKETSDHRKVYMNFELPADDEGDTRSGVHHAPPSRLAMTAAEAARLARQEERWRAKMGEPLEDDDVLEIQRADMI